MASTRLLTLMKTVVQVVVIYSAPETSAPTKTKYFI